MRLTFPKSNYVQFVYKVNLKKYTSSNPRTATPSGTSVKEGMAKGSLSRGSFQVARKTARGKPPNRSVAVTDTSTASSTVPRPPETGQSSTRHPSSSSSATSVRVSPEPAPSPDVCEGTGEISDRCYRNIVELFAKKFVDSNEGLRTY